MRKLLFASLFVAICIQVLLPITEAVRRPQSPNGPRREDTSARSKKKVPATKEKSARSSAALQEKSVEPVSVTALSFGESAPLSDIAAESVESDSSNEEQEAAENRAVRFVTEAAEQKAKNMSLAERASQDKALQTNFATLNTPSPLVTFEGNGRTENIAAGFGNLSPPDTNGDVGPNHYVQQTNLLVRVWNKSGVPLTAPFRLSSLWAIANGGPGGQCSASDAGDPIVLYDPLADRWMLSQFAFASQTAPPYHQCIAISKTNNPTGSYYLYDFVTGGTTGAAEFPDYPHLGVWPDGYYMMVHQFTNGGPFNGTGAYSFNRAKMLVGDPSANYIYFNLNLASHPEGIGGGLFADLDGLNPPPAGAPDIFAYLTATDFGEPANGIRLFNFHADFAVPASSTFTERPESSYAVPVLVAAFSLVKPAGRRAVPQPSPAAGVTTSLDAINDRFMHRMQYRNHGGFETLVLSHTVGAPGSSTFGTYRAAPRYYELRNNGAGYAVSEQATFAPGGSPGDSISRWMPSAAEDNQGNLAVGYSVSSGTAGGNVFPGIRYAGRLATDPPGGLAQGEATLINGTGVQTSTGNRWGDYSALTLDPSDDCTFWYTDEYYTAAGQAASTVGWQTRIGAFKFAQCTAPQMGTLSGTITFCDSGTPVPGALISVDGNLYAGTLANGTYSIKLPPGSHSVVVSAPGQSCNATTPTSVTINDGATTTFDNCLSGTANPAIRQRTVSGGNGNSVIDRNECNNLNLSVANQGCATLTNVFAILSTTTPGVTVTQPNSPYPDIPGAGTGVNSAPFAVSTSPAFACGTVINFSLKVKSDQGTFIRNFTMPTCAAPTTNLAGSIALTDLTQTGRINRFSPSSVCGVAKPNPGLFSAVGARHYDSYNFTNNGAVTACVTFTLTSGCSTNIYGVTYLGSFNPANPSQNFLGDFGASTSGTAVWSVDVPAGANIVLVVHEVNSNALCASYTATVSGLFSNTDGGGECTPNLCQITCPSDITQANDAGECGAVVNYVTPTSGVCGVVTCDHPSGSFFPVGTTLVTCTTQAESSCSFNVTVNDTEPPQVGTLTVDKPFLWPPNHQLIPIIVSYSASDNCSATCALTVTSSEPDNGLGDGDTANDIQIVDDHHVLLRAERSGKGNGRTYAIKTTCTDAAGNSTMSGPVNVIVQHDMRSPNSGAAFRINTPISFSGTFWDTPGKVHAAQWVFDNGAAIGGSVTEPTSTKPGSVKGTYAFSSPGVYLVTMKVTDTSGGTGLADQVNGLTALVVIYDPNAGYVMGGGWSISPIGAFTLNPGIVGDFSFGFITRYFKNSQNPKGSLDFSFRAGGLLVKALNFDYLTISGARLQAKGQAWVNGDGSYGFIVTAIDGQVNGGGGVDKVRIKIWSKNTGVVIYDNQMGSPDNADPISPVGSGSSIVIQQ